MWDTVLCRLLAYDGQVIASARNQASNPRTARAIRRPRRRRRATRRATRYAPVMDLHGRHVTLRPVTPDDAPILAQILAEPAVARWWGTFDLERVRRDLTAGAPDEEGFAIEHEGAVVGYIQSVEEAEPDFRHAGIDLFLRTDAQGRGLGPDAIRTLAIELIDATRAPPDHDRSGRREHPRDRRLREARFPAGGGHAPLPADDRWTLGRRAADGPAGRGTGALTLARVAELGLSGTFMPLG